MSRFNKLLQRIMALSRDLRFDEVRKVLEAYGYVMYSSGGSHRKFRKPGRDTITIPEESPVKQAYVVDVRDAIEREGF